MKKFSLKSILPFLVMAGVFTFALVVFSPEEAAAAWKKAGITPQGDLKNSKIYDDMKEVIYLITGVGAIWALGCIIFAGMRLSAAQGGNPQARSQGIVGLLMAGIGIWVIVKAQDIAGYFAGFGA